MNETMMKYDTNMDMNEMTVTIDGMIGVMVEGDCVVPMPDEGWGDMQHGSD